MEQFEQLLTCAICLDRYRNPKLLPCQHSFCMEPCMDGLMDYVRRQVKCPECRAEHRIPYQGVQGYPTNVTLQRFLELHIEITGELPDPTSGQVMERCNVCSEKSYCVVCHHCEKKICADCKGAHMDILRREISRINNQVRRALHRLEDMLSMVDKNLGLLQQNCCSVSEEVDEIDRRIAKALKDRTEFLRNEIDRYLTTEVRNLSHLKENLELEISNISSNCDLADKHMTEAVDWDDCELMDAKEIFLKTVEFIRNFETETGDYQRRVRLALPHDPNQLVSHVAGYADLNIAQHHNASTTGDRLGLGGGVSAAGSGSTGSAANNNLLQALGPGLMRSKSDHRLATQFRQQEERYDDDRGRLSPLGGRKFGERRPVGSATNTDRYGEGRYGREGRDTGRAGGDYDYGDYEGDGGRTSARSKYRSRFRHGHGDPADSDPDTGRSVRFQEQQQQQQKPRERVLDTEDVARGPLSGITRLLDSPRVMKRLQDSEIKERNKDKQPPAPAPQPPTPVQTQQTQPKTPAQRQVSEEDEIAKIKRQNKSGPSSESTTPNPAADSRPVADRVAALKRVGTTTTTGSGSSDDDQRRSTAEATSDADSDEGTHHPTYPQRRTSTPTGTGRTGSAAPGSRRSSAASDQASTQSAHKKPARSASTDSSTSSESSASPASPSAAVRNTGAAFTTQEKYLSRGGDKSTPTPTPESPVRSRAAAQTATGHQDSTPPRFQSRFLGSGSRASSQVDKSTKEEEEDETESSSEEETDSDDDEEDKNKKTAPQRELDRTDIGPLLARSANARDTSATTRRDSRDESTNQQEPQPPAAPAAAAAPARPWRQSRPWLQQQPARMAAMAAAQAQALARAQSPPPADSALDLPESTSPRGPSPTNSFAKPLPNLEQTRQAVNRFLRNKHRGGPY